MPLQPRNVDELRAALADTAARRQPLGGFDLSAFNRLVEHTPEDMTVTVEAGLSLGALQARLRAAGQWLPVDPPFPDRLTIGALLAGNKSGPRRYGYGAVREHLLGLKAMQADGRVIQSGGKVVKNVAGYELLKLFIGSRGSLGIILEVTFKVRPVPAAERVVAARCLSLVEASERIESVLRSELVPVVLDLHNSAPTNAASPGALMVVLAFAGSREEVDWQTELAGRLGFTDAASLDYDAALAGTTWGTVRKLSVLPSKLSEQLATLGGAPFVARAGNGIIYTRGEAAAASPPAAPPRLAQRLKEAFDPLQLFPAIPA
jgi:glycolate oxidase FAD binding subunit